MFIIKKAKMKSQFCHIIIFCFAVGLSASKKEEPLAIDNVFRFSETILIDGLERSYVLNLPPNYYDAIEFSLVIAMHGGAGSAAQLESTSKLTEKANADNPSTVINANDLLCEFFQKYQLP